MIVENTVERMGDLMEDTAERVGVLVEGTADKVARTAERLAELTEDAAARVSATLGQKDMSGLDEAGKEGGPKRGSGHRRRLPGQESRHGRLRPG